MLVAASPDLLDRLIGVLLDNACKYAPEEGTVDVTVAADGSRATVTVDDSGPGIAEEDAARIFDRFHRSVATSSEAGRRGPRPGDRRRDRARDGRPLDGGPLAGRRCPLRRDLGSRVARIATGTA